MTSPAVLIPHPSLVLHLIIALASVFISSAGILIESPDSSVPALYKGSSVQFRDNHYISCMCLRHIWAIQLTQVDTQALSWHVLGSDGPKCFKMGIWAKWLLKLGENSTSPGFLHLPTSQILIMNRDNWEIHFKTGQQAGVKICLPGTMEGTYCTYDFTNYSIPSYSKREEIYSRRNECDPGTPFLSPSTCQSIFPSGFDPSQNEIDDSGAGVCDLVKKHRAHSHKRHKRQAPTPEKPEEGQNTIGPTPPGGGVGGNGTGVEPVAKHENDWDEDYIAPEDAKYYLSIQTMIDSMEDYIVRKASELAGVLEKPRGRQAVPTAVVDLPVTTLLRLSVDVMKKICTAVPSVAFDIAFESFLLEQMNIHHLKEPYIAYGPYVRIKQALEKCLAKAEPFTFFQNDTRSDENSLFPTNVTCGLLEPQISTSYSLDKRARKILLGVDVPEYTSSDPNAHEPIIELTWKAFVNAHNYCFKYFQLYFNDHHTYTVSVMPFFTNKIQDTWYIGINYTDTDFPTVRSSGNLNYATKRVWYGDFFGNLSSLYYNLDHCLSANKRANRNYPWFLNRPPRDPFNEWSRKKREVAQEEDHLNKVDISQEALLQDCECKGDDPAEPWEIEKCRALRAEKSKSIF